jgi:glutamyl-tRNA synthetase
LLSRFKDHLATVEPFEAGPIETALKQFVDDEGIKIGQIIHAVRVAVTGKAVGFGLFETLEILGPQRCQARIERALTLV